ncbi:general secretion pathway protein J [Hoeflea marina]|uniref:Type II secretion system protein J n=1 Tax=Hoeflea marina TaxID=274592 RepID=A0A317PLX3_9HYPH|nr:type II secretion system protein GspJ [Hoeflea marina]PWW01513.1 general secretion pathway protein J [Hoeflea marina]
MAGADAGEAGFTLVEVLVTLALLSVMAALMLLVAGQFRGLAARQADLAARQEAAAIVRHLGDEIAAARALPLMGADAAQKSPMAGGAAGLRFSAVVRTGSANSGLREVLIALRPGDRPRLVEIRRLRRMPMIAATEPEIVLADDVEALSLRYLSVDGWSGDWQGRPELPRAVDIRLSLRRNGRIVSAAHVVTTGLR